MGVKYYAVKAGRETGIFGSWEKCKEQVHGYPGAIYKSFPSKAEAEAFLAGGSMDQPQAAEREAISAETEATAYVDGSYRAEDGRFSCGVVFFWQGETWHFSESFSDPDLATMHNVAGELKGAEIAIRFALEKKIQSLAIYHDYEGIARWCTGDWQTKKEGTRAYRRFCLEAQESIRLVFIKVKGHSGNPYNDLADELAKHALSAPLGQSVDHKLPSVP